MGYPFRPARGVGPDSAWQVGVGADQTLWLRRGKHPPPPELDILCIKPPPSLGPPCVRVYVRVYVLVCVWSGQVGGLEGGRALHEGKKWKEAWWGMWHK